MTTFEVTEGPVVWTPPCGGCDAKLADLTASVAGMAERVDAVVIAINTVGGQSQQHTDDLHAIVQQIKSFGDQMGSMGPAGLLKAVMGGKRNG